MASHDYHTYHKGGLCMLYVSAPKLVCLNCLFNEILVEPYSVLHAMSQIKNRYLFMLLKEDSLVL
jgi:hypothetical protein